VQIPGGVDVGTQIRLAGEGGPGTLGGPNGSLFLVLDVKPHKFFQRRENDIILNLDVNIAQAALGAEVDVPTLDGDEKLKIPAGTQSGKVFTMKGKGVPHVRSKNHRGNQRVIVNVVVPTKLSKEQRELFEKLAESLGTEVMPQEKGFIDWLNEAFGG
jgi:molecular chaperone DnaJ